MEYPWLIEQKGNTYVVDKPYGLPSFFVVEIYKALLHNKVGHGGTLDPLATGKLLILTANDTKKADTYLAGQKTYEFIMLLGAHTISGDLEQPLQFVEISSVTKEQCEQAVGSFHGEYLQEVPSFSAVKSQGQALYKGAAAGKERPMDVPARLVNIPEIALTDFSTVSGKELKQKLQEARETLKNAQDDAQKIFKELTGREQFKYQNIYKVIDAALEQNQNSIIETNEYNLLTITATVSKGTYIRTLADDIGKKSGSRGVVFSLERTKV